MGRSIIKCLSVEIGDNVTLLNDNVITCSHLKIGANTSILEHNRISGPGSFTIGENSRIIYGHYFDTSSDITIGNNTWIAGRNSQFWTHGSTKTKTKAAELGIELGDHVYVGSATLIGPGVKIGNLNLIGLGSVLCKSFADSHNFILGNPAVIVKQDEDWREGW
ncbi:acyltransferase [Croceiramulus getboli]|nr:hypothetical protein P8624_08425 [Flavobacteriaceae bacterium YJPT1-3]